MGESACAVLPFATAKPEGETTLGVLRVLQLQVATGCCLTDETFPRRVQQAFPSPCFCPASSYPWKVQMKTVREETSCVWGCRSAHPYMLCKHFSLH